MGQYSVYDVYQKKGSVYDELWWPNVYDFGIYG